MDLNAEAAALAAHAGRSAGSDAERRAAVHLRDRLTQMGRSAQLQPLLVRPRFGLVHALHATVAIVGSVVASGNAVAGAVIVGVATLSAFLDVAGIAQLGRRLTGKRASQNVESREGEDEPGTLLLVAACDAPRVSTAFARTTRILRDPWAAMLLAMTAILACCGLRIAGVEAEALTVVQFVPTVFLILLTPALADIELQPAAADLQGAGAAGAVLRLADELQLEHFDVWVLFAGATRPFALGMRGWLRRNRKSLDRETTAVIEVGPIGDGPVRYARRAGALVPARCHRDLVRLCREIAEDDGEDGAYGARSELAREPGNAAAAIARGLPAIRVRCDGAGDPAPESLERAYGFCAELARRLDREVGPSLRRE